MEKMRSCLLLVALLAFSLIVTAEAKKEKPLSPPFPKDVVNAVRCDVCPFLMRRAYTMVKTLFDASVTTRVRVSEDDVLTATEELCLPLSESGRWIRRMAIDPVGAARPFLKVAELPVDCKCKRTCSTVVEACEAILDDDSMDGVPARLLKIEGYADADDFARRVCEPAPFCKPRRGLPDGAYEELRAMIEADVPEEISSKEMEVERMMDEMERKDNRRQDIFTREEVHKMQRGLLDGDREAIAALDPSILDLSDEEFEALRHMVPDEASGDGRDDL